MHAHPCVRAQGELERAHISYATKQPFNRTLTAAHCLSAQVRIVNKRADPVSNGPTHRCHTETVQNGTAHPRFRFHPPKRDTRGPAGRRKRKRRRRREERQATPPALGRGLRISFVSKRYGLRSFSRRAREGEGE